VTISEAYKRPDLLTYLPQNNFIPSFLSLKRIFIDFNLSFKDFENYFPEFKDNENTLIRKLSGGQRRLVEVYVIIKSKSQFSMLDEPFSHLMPLQIEKISEILTNEKINKGILITDHMYRYILDICNDIYVLTDGSIKLTKSMAEIENLGYLKN
jgi:ABC-type lipopolysaccharide export system ATPase subunit